MTLVILRDMPLWFGEGRSFPSIELCLSGAKMDRDRLLDEQESCDVARGGEKGSNEVNVASDGLPLLLLCSD